MDIPGLLDAAKKAQGFETDMALAKALGISRSAVSAWREEAEMRLERVRARNKARKAGLRGEVTVIRIPLRDWHAEHFGSQAG